MENHDSGKLLEQLEKGSIAIYGTGFVADLVFSMLDDRGLADRIRCFIVTDGQARKEQFHERPVLYLSEYEPSPEESVLLAVHSSNYPAVYAAAKGKGIEGIHIYEYLTDLLYGEPLRCREKISVPELIARQDPENMWLAVRYIRCLAEEGLLGGGDELYRKAIALHAGPETAKLRAARAAKLTRAIREKGYDPTHPVSIDEDGNILNGLHRIAVCQYLGIREITADVYAGGPVFEKVIRKENRLPASDLPRFGFSEEEIAVIRTVARALRFPADTAAGIVGRAADAEKAAAARAEGRPLPPKISVILPAYNVEGYIDPCMETVCGQTFTDFEVLLIDDGSTDGTLQKCLSWQKKDPRIGVITRRNGGVASARNLGIELARGEYLAFVDPDDWLDLTYLEKLYECARKGDLNFVECDLYRYNGRNGTKILRRCGSAAGVLYTKEEHMIYGPTASYKAISKRSLWRKNGIRFPECSFESPAVYALVLAAAGKTGYVEEPLYYYRRFRENSLVETGYARKDGSADPRLGIDAMEALRTGFIRCGFYGTCRETLERVVKYRLSDILAAQYHRRSRAEYETIASNCFAYVKDIYPDSFRYFIFGGYNLNRILSHMRQLQDPDDRFNFSSVIGLLGEAELRTAAHKNPYRRIMVQREWDRDYFRHLAKKRPAFVFMDFIEERFDILKTDRGYLTVSDAFEGLKTEGQAMEQLRGERIPRASRECGRLFEEAFRAFVKRTEEICPETKIVVVENYLCERVGDSEKTEEFPEAEKIREMNRLLKEYYDHVREAYPRIPVLAAGPERGHFTDKEYEYGAVPQHGNAPENRRIAKRLEEICEG